MSLAEFALLATLPPFVGGVAIARALVSLGLGGAVPWLALVVPPLAFLAALASRLTAWDGLASGLCITAGLLVGLAVRAGRGRRAALAVSVFVVGLLLVELVARQGPPTPRPVTTDRVVLPTLDPRDVDTADLSPDESRSLLACALAFPQALPGPAQRRIPEGDRPVVLVLGDSMTAGLARDTSTTWPARWQALDPARSVVSAAVVGASADLHLAVLRGWKPLLGGRVERVVLQLFVNDVNEYDRPWPCCDERSILSFEGVTASLRCATPSWSAGAADGWRRRLWLSPPSLQLRALAEYSEAARRLVALHAHWQLADSGLEGEAGERLAKLGRVLRAIVVEAGPVPVTAVVMPWRPLFEPGDPRHAEARERHAELFALAAAAGLPVLDPTETLAALLKERGEAAVFLPNGEHHFAAPAHDAIARWIAGRLDTVKSNP